MNRVGRLHSANATPLNGIEDPFPRPTLKSCDQLLLNYSLEIDAFFILWACLSLSLCRFSMKSSNWIWHTHTVCRIDEHIWERCWSWSLIRRFCLLTVLFSLSIIWLRKSNKMYGHKMIDAYFGNSEIIMSTKENNWK